MTDKESKDLLNGNYLYKKQVAEKLGVSTKTIENYIKDGKLTAYKLCGKIVILEKDLTALITKV